MRSLIPLAALLALLTLASCGQDAASTSPGADPDTNNADQPDTCRTDRDCPVGTSCQQGLCLPDDSLCLRNADCPQGMLCDPDTQLCIPAPTPDLGQDLPDEPAEDLAEDLSSPEDLPDPEDLFDPPDVKEDLAAQDLRDDSDARALDLGGDQGAQDLPEDLAAQDLSPDAAEDLSAPDLPPEDLVAEDLVPEDLPSPDLTPDEPDLVTEDIAELDVSDFTQDFVGEPDLAPDLPVDLPPEEPDMMAEVDMTPEPDMFEPPPTPSPGVYSYSALEIGGLDALHHVAFHPGGDYALVLEGSNTVHVVDWASGTATRLELGDPLGDVIWSDVAFDPLGEYALLVGWLELDGSTPGVVVRFDDAAWRGLQGQEALTRYDLLWDDPLHALRFPGDGGLPVMLGRRGTRSPYQAVLRDFDPETGLRGAFATLTSTDAGCDDLDFVNNEHGDPGILVVCGHNGADVHFYTEVGGVPEWRANPGNNNLGNTSSVAAHPSGDYALVLSWSGRSIYRFEAGQLNGYSDAPRFSRRAIQNIVFQQEGQRALITGGSWFSSSEDIGIVLEFRHDEYACFSPENDCDITAVHIQGYDQPPFNAIRNTFLHDAAFRPGCDGGLIVTGFEDFRTSQGQIIRFQIDNGRACP